MNLRAVSALAFCLLAWDAPGQSSTTNKSAYTLVKEGDLLVAPLARDKLREIRSEKSSGGLVPRVWFIDYLDPSTAFKTTEVKFIAGEMAEIKRPEHITHLFSGARSLSWRRLKIDSDRALAIALSQPDLKHLDLKAAQYWLEPVVSGANWQIRFWTPWPGGITDVFISAESGKVVKIVTSKQKRDKSAE